MFSYFLTERIVKAAEHAASMLKTYENFKMVYCYMCPLSKMENEKNVQAIYKLYIVDILVPSKSAQVDFEARSWYSWDYDWDGDEI